MRAILTYHSIDTSGSPISVHPQVFAQHVDWLTSGSVKVVTIDALMESAPEMDAVAVTFDDGFANIEDEACARLLGHGLSATIFVVTDHVGRTNSWPARPAPGIPILPLLDWPALERLASRGLRVGAHSRTHRDLVGVDGALLEDEIAGSAETITQTLGQRPDVFAYPYGRIDAAAAGLVGRYYKWGCGTVLSWLGADNDPARLPRIDAYYLRSPGRLDQFGSATFRCWLRARGAARWARERVAPWR
jgi:peptidoglycan/xylan/chitin deacetylase (PgdA/CDA1 family)